MDISGIGLVTGSVMHESLSAMVADYNENISYYNRNMRDILRIYERAANDNIARLNIVGNTYLSRLNSTISNTNISRETDISGNIHISRENSSIPSVTRSNINQTNTSETNRNNTIRNPYQRTSFFNTPLNRTFNAFGGLNYLDIIRNDYNYQDVIVRPTNEQISRATDIIRWSPNMSQTTCPISLEPFQYNQNVCIIRNCGHMYNYEPLIHWFETNVRCPVCRYDIRDYIPDNTNTNTNTNTTTNQDTSANIVSYDESDNDSLPDLISADDSEINNEDTEQADMNMEIDEPETIIRQYIISEAERINNQQNNTEYNYNYNNNMNNRNLLQNNISNIFSSILNNPFDQNMPIVNSSVNDFFYTLNIPLEVDISYINTQRSRRNIG
jgi:hypothetical protein